MAEEETVRPSVDPSAAIAGLAVIGASMTTILGLATGIGVAFAGWQISSTLFQAMKTAESQLIRLKTAMQDSVKGAQEYVEALKFAARTPFPVESVIEAAAQLRVFQLDPFKKVNDSGRELLTVLGDMAGAMGQDVSLAVHALNRAMVGEWEIMKNNFQISARMIPQLNGLTSGTEEYKQALIEYLETQERFKGGMDLQAKSIQGMLSNLGDASSLIITFAAGVADSEMMLKGGTLYDSVRASIEKVYTVVTESGDAWIKWGRILGQIFDVVFNVVMAPSFDRAASALQWFADQADKVLNFFVPMTEKMQQAVAMTAEETSDILAKLTGMSEGHIQHVVDFYEEKIIATKNAGDKQMLIFMILMKIYTQIIKEMLGDLFENIMEWVNTVAEPFKRLFDSALAAWEDNNLFARMSDGLQGFANLVGSIMGLIGNYITGVVGGAIDFIVKSGMLDDLAKGFGDIFDAVAIIGDALSEAFGEGGGFFKTIGQIFGTVFLVPMRIVANLFKFIGAIVKQIASDLVEWGVVDDISATFSILSELFESLSPVFSEFGAIFKEIFGGEGGEGFKTFVKLLSGVLITNLKIIVFMIRSFATALGVVVNLLDGDFAGAAEKLNSWSDSLMRGLSGVWDTFAAAFQTVLNVMTQIWYASPFYQIYRGIKDFMNDVTNSSPDRVGGAKSVRMNPTGAPQRHVGEWAVPRDMTAWLQRGEMVIPQDEARRIRELFTSPSGSPRSAANMEYGTAGGGSSNTALINALMLIVSMFERVASRILSVLDSITQKMHLTAIDERAERLGRAFGEAAASSNPIQQPPASSRNQPRSDPLIFVQTYDPSKDLPYGNDRIRRSILESQYKLIDPGTEDLPPTYQKLQEGAMNILRNTNAMLHQGEMVLPQRFADAVRREFQQPGGSGGDRQVIVNNYFQHRVTSGAVPMLSDRIRSTVETLKAV